jgi:putative flippase GtrA
MRLIHRFLTRLPSSRWLRFGAVGATGAVVNLAALYAAQEFLFRTIADSQMRLNCSLAVAIAFATINNFSWNRIWTWRDRRRAAHSAILIQFGQYALACWVGVVLQIVFTKLLAAHLNYLIANFSAIAGASIFNYLVNDLWTFGRDREAAGKQPADLPCGR